MLQPALHGLYIQWLHQAAWPAACQCQQVLQQHRQAFSTSSAAAAAKDKELPTRLERRRTRNPDAWKSRLPPGAGRYGSILHQQDPERFERMRVICGFYDSVSPSQRPRHVTINNLQTLQFLRDIDPYYKLSLVSYRSKLLNKDLLGPLSTTQAYLNQLGVQQSAFTPTFPGFTAGPTTTAAASSSAAATQDGSSTSTSSSAAAAPANSNSSSSSSSSQASSSSSDSDSEK